MSSASASTSTDDHKQADPSANPSSSSVAPSPSSALSRRSRIRAASFAAAPNEVRVSPLRPTGYFVAIAMRLLISHEVIVVMGVGAAVGKAIDVAQTVVDTGFGVAMQIRTGAKHTGLAPPKPHFRMEIKRLKMPTAEAPMTSDERKLVAAAEGEDKSAAQRAQTQEGTEIA